MEDNEATSQLAGCSACRWHCAWACVFAANLPLPVLLGSELGCEVLAGMVAGIGVWLLVTHLAFHRIESLRGVMLCGGGCVALSQVVGVLHLFAGIVAAYISVFVFDVPGRSFAAGFWLTVFTGAELMVVALMCGSFLWEIVRLLQEAS